MYNLEQIKRGLTNHRALGRELNRQCHTRLGQHRFNPAGSGIFDFDWDTLVILDACRYDVFSDIANLPGTMDWRYSLAPTTYEFIRANFTNVRFYDTIYLGAATWYLRLKDEVDADLYKVLNLQSGECNARWADENLKVPHPSSVTEKALDIYENFPSKRMIVHYLQPHHPFIGPIGKSNFVQQSSSLLDVVAASSITDSMLQAAYRENLQLVLGEVEQLVENIDGRTIITADHGEMLGDTHQYVPVKDYGHHVGIFNDPTTKVPLHIHESGERRITRADAPCQTESTSEQELDEQLRNLGYKI